MPWPLRLGFAHICLCCAAPAWGFNWHTRRDVITETSPGWHHTASSGWRSPRQPSGYCSWLHTPCHQHWDRRPTGPQPHHQHTINSWSFNKRGEKKILHHTRAKTFPAINFCPWHSFKPEIFLLPLLLPPPLSVQVSAPCSHQIPPHPPGTSSLQKLAAEHFLQTTQHAGKTREGLPVCS